MIPYGRQDISPHDIDAVVEVLRSDFLTQGNVTPAFEESVAGYVGCKHAVAVNSATSALHIACLALGVGPGDLVWTSAITFVASANCAVYCGADVDFIDIDGDTCNISVKHLRAKLEQSAMMGRLPKVVIPVHFAGQSCDMAAIHALSARYGFRVIEDASHAIGGSYEESRVGAGQYSDIVVFSFHPVKIITTAEGGMALTNDDELAQRLRLLRTHGITRNPPEMVGISEGPWYYEQVALGFNYRMTELQAALGISQMRRLNEFVERRHELAEIYGERLSALPVEPLVYNQIGRSALHLYVIKLPAKYSGSGRLAVFNRLREVGIGVNVHYIPVYKQPYYANKGFPAGYCPVAEDYYGRAITLPLHPGLSRDQQDYIINELKRSLEG